MIEIDVCNKIWWHDTTTHTQDINAEANGIMVVCFFGHYIPETLTSKLESHFDRWLFLAMKMTHVVVCVCT